MNERKKRDITYEFIVHWSTFYELNTATKIHATQGSQEKYSRHQHKEQQIDSQKHSPLVPKLVQYNILMLRYHSKSKIYLPAYLNSAI